MRVIANLEIHVAHACNLACESCGHYSNQGHKGMVTVAEAARWMSLWHGRVSPQVLSLLGGEPTINPRLPDFLVAARTHWSQAHVRLVTNGFFLHRHPTLPHVMKGIGNSGLYISIHHMSAEYLDKLRPVIALVSEWAKEHGIQAQLYHSHQTWTRQYNGFGAAMTPFADGQPRQSWEHCIARYYQQLFEGKLWKCAPLAYLPMQDAKYHLSEQWRPYLQYQPLEPTCSDAELNAFLDREHEPACGMCPANPERFEMPLPLPGRKTDSLPVIPG